jgi:hypothetical protein
MGIQSRKMGSWRLASSLLNIYYIIYYSYYKNYYRERENKIDESTFRKPVSATNSFSPLWFV